MQNNQDQAVYMNMAISLNESLAEGVRRIGTELIDEAIAQLQVDEERHKGIHQARKHFKKVRALLRLVRDSIGRNTYKAENAFFRDTSRKLSGIRDITAMIETLNRIADRYAGRFPRYGFFRALDQLKEQQYEVAHRLLDQKGLLEEVVADLHAARKRMQALPVGPDAFSTLEKSLRRVYKRGYLGLEVCEQTPDVHDWHNWRKRVKYLWHQLQMLNELWPEMLTPHGDELHRLSDFLGDDHDLFVLWEMIDAKSLHYRSHKTRQGMKEIIEDYRLHLQGEALYLGKKLYYESPRAFTRRVQAYWDVWRSRRGNGVATLNHEQTPPVSRPVVA